MIYKDRSLFLVNHSNGFYTDLMQKMDPDEKTTLIYDLMNPEFKTFSLEMVEIQLKKPNNHMKTTKIQGFDARKLDMHVIYKRIKSKKTHEYLRIGFEEYKANSLENPQEKSNKIKRFKQEMSLWMSEEFPLKLKDFLPLLKLLAKGNGLLRTLMNFLENKQVFKGIYCVKEGIFEKGGRNRWISFENTNTCEFRT